MSPLRKDQVERTRERILEGLLVAMKSGLAELSVPAVARAARVSVPTVYRHFPTKKALFEALATHVGTKTRLVPTAIPKDPGALFAWIRDAFQEHDRLDPTVAAAMAGVLGGEFRREAMMPNRLKMIEKALAPAMSNLSPQERTYLRNLTVVLTASSTAKTFKSYLGVSAEDAADTVIWALRSLSERAVEQPGGKRWKAEPKKGK